MALVLHRPIEGYLGKVMRTRVHYNPKFLPGPIAKRILLQTINVGKLAPIRFKLSQKIWIVTPAFGFYIPFGLTEIKYHNILETDDGDRFLISWDYVSDKNFPGVSEHITRLDQIVSEKRVRINAYWTIKHRGMADNLGLGTTDIEHYPKLDSIQVLE